MKVRTLLPLLLLAAPMSAKDKKKEWANDISYTTSWEEAIKECRNTGKMLFIYNGWERAKI